MLIVSEAVCRAVVSRADAFDAVEAAFGAMARGEAANFPVVREAIGHANALYGFKSGFDRANLVLGVKSGGYWPQNAARGLTNHQSTVILFDPDTGRALAVVGGNYLTAVRTAAASAISIRHLARKDSRVLGILGAGHQAAFQLRAAAEQCHFARVLAWNRSPGKLSALAEVAVEAGLSFAAVERERLCAEADVIVTITSAFEPLIRKEWVRPGTHMACMGTDTKGKQEVDPSLVAAASLFADDIGQSTVIGETQHAVRLGLVDKKSIVAIGSVINGNHPGRTSDDEISLFDGTGIGLQDLAVAAAALRRAEGTGLAQRVEF